MNFSRILFKTGASADRLLFAGAPMKKPSLFQCCPRVLCTIFAVIGVATAAASGGPSVTVTASPTRITNQGDEAVYTFTLSSPAPRSIAIDFIMSGTASIGADYALLGNFNKLGQVVIPAGQTSAMVTLHAFVEDVEELPRETSVLNLLNGRGYHVRSPSQAQVMIVNVN